MGVEAFRDWRPRSDVGWFNLLDYPFAAIRALANNEPFQPSGRSFPLAVLALVGVAFEYHSQKKRERLQLAQDMIERLSTDEMIAFAAPTNWCGYLARGSGHPLRLDRRGMGCGG
jgi:hypothetical protein